MIPFRKTALSMVTLLALSLNAATTEADVVAVVSADNPVNTLSRNELINIFLGKTQHFPDGSAAKPIDQNEDTATHEAFYVTFANKSEAQIKSYWSKMIFTGRGRPPKSVTSGEEVKSWLAENPEGIGYLDESYVDDSLKILQVR